MGDKKECGVRPQLGEAGVIEIENKMRVFKEKAHGDKVELEERDDLLLYVEERGPRKGSQQSEHDIFQTVSDALSP